LSEFNFPFTVRASRQYIETSSNFIPAWPDSYDERVLPSIGNEVLKATVAQFDAAELITQREVVSAKIRQDLLTRAREFNILLEDVSIVSYSLWEWLSVAYHVRKNGLTDTFELVRPWFAMSL